MKLSKGKLGAVLAAALVVGGPMAAVGVIPAVAAAQSAAAKATVDAAKARGEVGEQADGYLGLVKGSADAATTAAVQEINAGRTAAYREAAGKTQVTVDAAAGATATQLIARVPAGQFYKDASGKWVKK
jgi:uncharacterized protein YdbL (DUF1318 family)